MAKIIDYDTKNTSFVKVHEQLKTRGIENNDFMLELRNKKLKDTNPYFDRLMPNDVEMIRREARLNIWYFLRECCTLHMGYEPTGSSEKINLNMGLLAMAWLAEHGYSYLAELPRQLQKTTGSLFILQWFYMMGNSKKQYEVIGRNEDHKTLLCEKHAYEIVAPGYLVFTPNPQDRFDHPVWYGTAENLVEDITGSTKVCRMLVDDFYHFTNNKEAYEAWEKACKSRPVLMLTGTPHKVDSNSSDYLKFAREFSEDITVTWKNEWYDHPEDIPKDKIIKVKFLGEELVDDYAKYEERMRKGLRSDEIFDGEVLLKWD